MDNVFLFVPLCLLTSILKEEEDSHYIPTLIYLSYLVCLVHFYIANKGFDLTNQKRNIL